FFFLFIASVEQLKQKTSSIHFYSPLPLFHTRSPSFSITNHHTSTLPNTIYHSNTIIMASPPMIPANAPDWIKGWAKENAEFVSFLAIRGYFQTSTSYADTLLLGSFNAPSASEASRVAEAPVLKQDAVPFTNSRSFSEVSSVPRDPAYHYAPTTPPAAETASGISPDTDTIGQLGGPHKDFASRGPTTISEYAKRVAQDNPNDWAEYLQAYRQKFLEPDMFALDYAKNVELARDLLTHVLRDRVKIICCTPIALEQIVSHTGLQGDFVAIDEAHRMTEAMSAVVMSKCPRASFLLMGDTEQSNPQGPTSLLGRMERAGATLYHLKSNYRSG
ncbi:uncharacterized protein B0J16DRAFT_391698, partial [Fusarium flagelliforme]|uniref:uncharacterized protein n=1 Tax=Fusarium flagelliforme TaxID=2675880 RepID=UPI001E8D301D